MTVASIAAKQGCLIGRARMSFADTIGSGSHQARLGRASRTKTAPEGHQSGHIKICCVEKMLITCRLVRAESISTAVFTWGDGRSSMVMKFRGLCLTTDFALPLASLAAPLAEPAASLAAPWALPAASLAEPVILPTRSCVTPLCYCTSTSVSETPSLAPLLLRHERAPCYARGGHPLSNRHPICI